MTWFIGTYEHGLDDKGRMVLPAKFRSQLGETGVVAKLDGCLGLWTPEDFKDVLVVFEDAVEEAETPEARKRAMGAYRRFVGDALEVNPDQQGRIVINQTLRDYAGLGSEIVIKGLVRRAEIWNRDTWFEATDEDDAAVARTVSERALTGRRSPQ
ncbi:MAG: division/cell wall cluster transcriptional repressor MraZ [Acidimicrobiales bacterium]